MPEERGLYPKMKVLDQLVFLARLHGLERSEAERSATDVLGVLGVGERAGDRLEALSLGNQQRVQLAAALVHEPEVLVLDEPFSGLDPVGVDALAGVLRSEADRRGVPVLFSSHQLELVERLCDGVVLVAHGRIRAQGSIDELRATRARNLWRIHVDGPPGWEESIPGVTAVSSGPGELVLELDAGTDPQRLLDLGRRVGSVTLFEHVLPTLAELFREVTE